MWLEDMLTGDYVPWVNPQAYRELTTSTSTPIHTGEQIYLRHNFKELIETQAVRVIGPDPADIGGIAELKWVAEHAYMHSIMMAPHGTANGLLGLGALINVCATLPANYIAFEYPSASDPWWKDIVIGLPDADRQGQSWSTCCEARASASTSMPKAPRNTSAKRMPASSTDPSRPGAYRRRGIPRGLGPLHRRDHGWAPGRGVASAHATAGGRHPWCTTIASSGRGSSASPRPPGSSRPSPGASLLLLEKEDRVAVHQTGHNSGVIHAGIYYEPGSLKAQLCRAGAEMTRSFCTAHGIPFEQCGKLIVATNAKEVERIDALYRRATANGLSLSRLDEAELREREPNIAGIAALLSPTTGIVDYRRVSEALAALVRARGGEIRFGIEVGHISERAGRVEIGAEGNAWTARRLVVCGGLQSDRLALLAGLDIDFRIVPFRGEYYRLPAEKNGIIRHLIYPAPDPDLPFLGIHLTRMIDGSVTVGPNAVLGLAREGYPKFSLNPADAWEVAELSRVLEAHRRQPPACAARAQGLALESGLSRRMPEILPVAGARGPLALPRRHPGADRQARRQGLSRLPHDPDRMHAARLQRPVPGRHLGPADRAIDRRANHRAGGGEGVATLSSPRLRPDPADRHGSPGQARG